MLLFVTLLCLAIRLDASDIRSPGSQAEVDHIFSLLAYAVVFKDWQSPRIPNPRGHNIGAVLVDHSLQPVFWARNTNLTTNNSSQHAEVRLIYNFLECSTRPYMNGYTIYTTLEPCAMCTGMMSLTRVTRTVYGQEDPLFGNAFERLAADHSTTGGDPAYPILFSIARSPSSHAARLEESFGKSGDGSIVRWLQSDEARKIYSAAYTELISLDEGKLESDAGRVALARSRTFLGKVSSNYVENPADLCNPG